MTTAELRSPAVGRVLELLVAVDADVAAGDEIVVIESMKMEIPVAAPCDGRVAAIEVAPGDQVQAGDLLLTVAR